jgi:PPM family protein phosphatase
LAATPRPRIQNPMLNLEFAELTDQGLMRSNNEDTLGHVLPSSAAEVQLQGWFFALADGMGGHAHGEVASQLAIDTALEGFRKAPRDVAHASLLPHLVQEANTTVYNAGHAKHGSRSRMGTTFVACALRFDSAVVSHIGDSRCYLFRNGNLTPLTGDHTVANEQLRLGILSKEEAATSEGRHLLTRSLGGDLAVTADTITVSLLPGDTLLLCSDGLHGYVPDTILVKILQLHTDLNQAAKALVDASLDAGGHDNVSLQLIRVQTVKHIELIS